METVISASILSADLCNLERDIKKAEDAGCGYIHFDVMDGVFVNNISYGIPVLKSVSKITGSVLDVHLMIIDPIKYINAFADSGAGIITFHYESASDVKLTAEAIRNAGKKAGIAIKPKTPVKMLKPYLRYIDMVLIMTVEPGFGGQGFIYETLDKIKELRDLLRRLEFDIPIQVDGGINMETGRLAREAGADILVAGSYLFDSEDIKEAVSSLIS